MVQNKIAVALSGASNEECLRKIESVASQVALAEVRLDLMNSFDVAGLVKQSPIPLIMTYRPIREGGKYAGEETARLDVLREALDCGVAYIDIEADSLDAVAHWRTSNTRIIASHHDFEAVPKDLIKQYQRLRDRCDIVKLVGTAHNTNDNLAIFELLQYATTPVVTMAMGNAGRMTRILAPYFDSCSFTFGAVNEQEATAPGQLSVQTMINDLSVDKLSPLTSLRFRIGGQWRAEQSDETITFEVPDSDDIAAVLKTAFPKAEVLS